MADEQSYSYLPGAGGSVSRSERKRVTQEFLDRLREATGDEREQIIERVIVLNRCVAESIASRYSGRGVTADDVRQVACEGLVKAVRRFDPESGRDLLTFAVPTIRGEIRRYFRDHGWSVRPPRRIQELQQRIGQVVDTLGQELGREPGPDEIADRIGVSRAEYEDALGAYGCFSPTSLDQPLGDGGRTLADALPDEDEEQRAAEARLTLAPVLRELPAQDRRILYLRFFEDRTQSEIGEELGVTQTQVSRLLSGICANLRRGIEEGTAR